MERGRPSSLEGAESAGSAAERGAAPRRDASRVRLLSEARRAHPPQDGAPDLIRSRLRPPQPLVALVRREALLRRLATSAAPLLVVTAPGGYGKTVTLSQWAADDRIPFAWIQADAADNDPLLLLHYLTAALERVAHVEAAVQHLRLTPPPVETRVLPALAAAVAGAGPFVLVVDDAHLVTSEACWRILALLADQVPQGARLCLSGRTDPPLPLARLRAQGRLLELGPDDLALSVAEARALLALHDAPSDSDTAARLTEVTEGWAAGIFLAALAGEEASAWEALAGVRGDRRDIADYLAAEVLDQQPPALAEFLLRTSILERLSLSLCRAVTGRRSAGELLQAVARSHLFVNALDDTGEWFRYHHLFAEFLQAELVSRRGGGEAAALHRRAAAWFEEHDALEEAVRHWIAGGDVGRAGAIVCRCHMHYAHLARYETVRRWLDMFTDEQIFADPALTLAAGGIGSMAEDSPRVRGWIRASFRMDVGEGTWPGAPVSLRAMQAFMRAALSPDGLSQMRADSELGVRLGEGAPASMRAAVLAQLGIACWLTGDRDAALEHLREGETEGAVGNVLAQMTAQGYQALILADQGRWDEARVKTAAALALFEEAGLSVGIPVFAALLAQARIEAHDCDCSAAERLTPIFTFAAQGTTAVFQALLCDVIGGEVRFECGDVAGAERCVHEGFIRLTTWPDAGMLCGRLQRLKDRIEECRLVDPLTAAERRVLDLLPTEFSQREIADQLFVSRETVRTHVRDLYRKLEVHTRSQAVARARETGLLGAAPT